MLANSARIVPASASLSAVTGEIASAPLSRTTLTPATADCDKVPFGPLTVIAPAAMDTSTPLGRAIGNLATRDMHCLPDQATRQMTSPPTPAVRAWRSVMMPLDVELIAVPTPVRILGSSSRSEERRDGYEGV